MSTDLWIGIAIPLGVPVVLLAGYIAFTWLLGRLGDSFAKVLTGTTSATSETSRAAFAATAYAAERSWFLVLGNMSIGLFIGQSKDRRVEAYDRLLERHSIREGDEVTA